MPTVVQSLTDEQVAKVCSIQNSAFNRARTILDEYVYTIQKNTENGTSIVKIQRLELEAVEKILSVYGIIPGLWLDTRDRTQ